MLINGLNAVSAEKRRHLRAPQSARRQRRHARAGRHAGRCASLAVEAAAEAFPTWSADRPRRAPRAAAEGRRGAGGQDAAVRRGDGARDRRHRHVGRLQRASGRRHAARGGGAHHADRRRGDSRPTCRVSLAMGVRQPAGVVLGIAPWNAPIILGVRAIATPLACGNTVVLKGSRELPAHAPADHRGACRRPASRRASSTTSPTRRPMPARWSRRWSRTRRCGASTSPAPRASAG